MFTVSGVVANDCVFAVAHYCVLTLSTTHAIFLYNYLHLAYLPNVTSIIFWHKLRLDEDGAYQHELRTKGSN